MVTVIFDLDGTLIDSLPDVTKAVNLLLADEGLPMLGTSDVNNFVGSGEQVLMHRLIAATALKAEDFDRLMPRFITHYKTAALDTKVFPGAMDALKTMRNAGIPLGLCTNKPRAPLETTLVAAGLDNIFDVVMAGDDLPTRKPDPAPLLEAFQRLGAPKGIYVGDSEIDAETAERAGVPFVFYTEGIRVAGIDEIRHDIAFDDFAALPGICEQLTASGNSGG
ncbi:MAG: phosphoglycolate phosphatase [Boseongicola sp.]|nr:MAG: phosphoglycolate phosphatase [Boseongicola sp.]